MPFLLIKGSYRILGAAPDGDSIRFYPDDPENWNRLDALAKKHEVRPNPTGGVQLRLDGVDALETHYTASVKGARTRRQPAKWGDAASAGLLEFLGFDPNTVKRSDDERVSAAEPAEVPGFIASKFVDTYGRAVTFAFRGETLERDGDTIFLESGLLAESANTHLLAEGLAYPTFYAGLFHDLRDVLSGAVTVARGAERGLWPVDRTESGFTVDGFASITDETVMLPKLFRRLVEHLELGDGDASLDNLGRFLKAKDDRVTVLGRGSETGFDDLIEIDGQMLRLTEAPESLIFAEK